MTPSNRNASLVWRVLGQSLRDQGTCVVFFPNAYFAADLLRLRKTPHMQQITAPLTVCGTVPARCREVGVRRSNLVVGSALPQAALASTYFE